MAAVPLPISLADVESAAARLEGVAVRTPLLEYDALNRAAGGRVLVKFEGAQHTGSFKFRGAYNRISRLTDGERRGGVVAYSSGNHAQGVAAAAARVGVRALIVMPADAPAIKIENTRALGGEVVLYDRYRESREEIGGRLARERGATLVKPFDDPWVMAGQGTVGLEIAAQAEALGLHVDQAVVCCSGGGLVAGVATALRGRSPRSTVYAAEPAGFDDTARSLAGGARVENDPAARSICDALMAPTPGELTFQVNRALLAGGLVVTDDEVRAAIRFAFRQLKLVVEPGGAVALASVLAGRIATAGRTTAVVLSGANVDPVQYAAIVGSNGD